jgi:transposase-like protein
LTERYPQEATVLQDTAEELRALIRFPPDHQLQTASTNPLERRNRESGQHTDVVDLFRSMEALDGSI